MYRRTHFPTLFDLPSIAALPVLTAVGGMAGDRWGVAGVLGGVVAGALLGVACVFATLMSLIAIHGLLNRYPNAEGPLLIAYTVVAVAVPAGVVTAAWVIFLA